MKPSVAKATTVSKKPVAASVKDTVMPQPAVKKPPMPYFIDVRDTAVVAYYNDVAVDYAKVKVTSTMWSLRASATSRLPRMECPSCGSV